MGYYLATILTVTEKGTCSNSKPLTDLVSILLAIYFRKGPATRCDAVYPRCDVPMYLRCIKITCDALQCIFQYVGNFAHDFGISQLFTVRFSNGFYHNDRHLMGFHLIYVLEVYVIYF